MGKKLSLLFAFVLALSFLASVVSAEIIIQSEPEEIYNFGSVIELPVKIIATQNIEGTLLAQVLCDGSTRQFYMNDVFLEAGEEISLEPVLRITKERVGDDIGICKIKVLLGGDYELTDEFEISDLINVELNLNQTTFSPEDVVTIKGIAVREDGKDVVGVVELTIDGEVTNISISDTVRNGLFDIDFDIPKDMEAKEYLVNVKVYEKDSDGEITNGGHLGQGIDVLQIPTSLEISSDTQVVEPGTNLEVEAILHDQTGKPIGSEVIITIKDSKDNILKQVEVSTNQIVEYPVASDQAPEEWVVRGVSNKFVAEQNFEIAEKEAVESKIANGTLFLKNVGNVVYNQSLIVKIGAEELTLSPYIKVGQEKKYYLSAPDGDYDIEIGGSFDEPYAFSGVPLTGSVISIEEVSQGIVKIIRHPFVWIFIIIILGVVAYMVFKKGYKRSFIGRKGSSKKDIPLSSRKDFSGEVGNNGNKITTSSPAVLSLSLHGEKHKSGMVCLKVNNLSSLLSSKKSTDEGSAYSTLQQAVSLAEQNNAVVYENQEYFFFIFSPMKTRTFDNNKASYALAEGIKKMIDNHNKLYKEKISFGISLNIGEIVGKHDKESGKFKFMALGKLVSDSKKVATLSGYSYGDIYLTEEMNAKILHDAKTESHVIKGMKIYTVKEMKKKEQYGKFIHDFVRRQKAEVKKDVGKVEKSFKDEIHQFREEGKKE